MTTVLCLAVLPHLVTGGAGANTDVLAPGAAIDGLALVLRAQAVTARTGPDTGVVARGAVYRGAVGQTAVRLLGVPEGGIAR